MPPPFSARMRTPFAVLGIRTGGRMVTGIEYLPPTERPQAPDNALAERAVRQIERYLADPHFRFTLPLAAAGTPFRRRVRQALAGIPVGESRTYGELARLLHTAPRAVGGACGANGIALVIPCHRVVGSQGSLGGFMGAAGPPQGTRPLGGTARSDARGDHASAAGPPQGTRLLGGAARSDARGDHTIAVEGDPIAIKRWLLAHEGYRFGA